MSTKYPKRTRQPQERMYINLPKLILRTRAPLCHRCGHHRRNHGDSGCRRSKGYNGGCNCGIFVEKC